VVGFGLLSSLRTQNQIKRPERQEERSGEERRGEERRGEERRGEEGIAQSHLSVFAA
jgi:hypothetical protein